LQRSSHTGPAQGPYSAASLPAIQYPSMSPRNCSKLAPKS